MNPLVCIFQQLMTPRGKSPSLINVYFYLLPRFWWNYDSIYSPFDSLTAMWVSASPNIPTVQWGSDREHLTQSSQGKTATYSIKDLCTAPANLTENFRSFSSCSSFFYFFISFSSSLSLSLSLPHQHSLHQSILLTDTLASSTRLQSRDWNQTLLTTIATEMLRLPTGAQSVGWYLHRSRDSHWVSLPMAIWVFMVSDASMIRLLLIIFSVFFLLFSIRSRPTLSNSHE